MSSSIIWKIIYRFLRPWEENLYLENMSLTLLHPDLTLSWWVKKFGVLSINTFGSVHILKQQIQPPPLQDNYCQHTLTSYPPPGLVMSTSKLREVSLKRKLKMWNHFLQHQEDHLGQKKVTNYHFWPKWSSEFEENDSNDTLACDDDAHKVVLCTPSLFLEIIITNFTMKPFFACFRRWT